MAEWSESKVRPAEDEDSSEATEEAAQNAHGDPHSVSLCCDPHQKRICITLSSAIQLNMRALGWRSQVCPC